MILINLGMLKLSSFTHDLVHLTPSASNTLSPFIKNILVKKTIVLPTFYQWVADPEKTTSVYNKKHHPVCHTPPPSLSFIKDPEHPDPGRGQRGQKYGWRICWSSFGSGIVRYFFWIKIIFLTSLRGRYLTISKPRFFTKREE